MSYKEIAERSPYYDDYIRELNFLRVLFHPGRAVQARELTQVQTILQNQLSSMAGHFFKNNSVIVGAEVSLSRDKPAAQVYDQVVIDRETGQMSASPLTAQIPIENLIGRQFVNVDPQVPSNPDPDKTLTITHVREDSPGSQRFFIYYTFSGATPKEDDLFFDAATGNIIMRLSGDYFKAAAIKCDPGIIYRNGHFISVTEQESIAGNDRDAAYSVGYRFDESVVTENTKGIGQRLLDPAKGFYNFSAPGAHRYRVNPVLDSYLTNEQASVDQEFLNKFVPYLRTEAGTITYDKRDPDYGRILDLLARRTYDQAGDFTVKPFRLSVLDEPVDDPSKITFSVSPGLAYVRGYEVKKITSTEITTDRARDWETLESTLATAGDTLYFVVKQDDRPSIQGYENFSEKPEMTVYSKRLGVSAGEAGPMGTLRVEGLVQVGNELRLYVSDLSSQVRNNMKQVRSLRNASVGIDISAVEDKNVLAANVSTGENSITSATGTRFLRAIHRGDQVPFVAEINDVLYARNVFGGDSSCDLASVREAEFEIVGSSLQATIVAGSANVRFFPAISALLFQANMFDSSFSPSSDDIEVTVDTVSSPQSITVTITGDSFDEADTYLTANPGASRTARIYMRERLVQAQPRSKVLTNHESIQTINLGASKNATAIEFITNRQDGYALTGITLATNVAGGGTYSLTEAEVAQCTFFDGQRDTYYDDIVVTIPRSVVNPHVANSSANTEVRVQFSYFEHSQGANQHYFSKASYPFTNQELEKIPSYRSRTSGKTFDLINCIDWRQKKGDESSSRFMIIPQTNFETSAETFLPRRDIIAASYDGAIRHVKGISSRNPELPQLSSGSLMLHSIYLNPYTESRRDVQVKAIDNQRYTMKEIGALDKRIENLERLTSLTLLEQKAETLKIIDSATGLDKFKSGIFADPIRNHSLGAKDDPEYRIAASPTFGGGRCPQRFHSVELTLDEPDDWGASYFTSTNISVWDNLISITPTGEEVVGENLTASGSVNVNPYLFYTWNGQVDLIPAVDSWFDTVYLPDVNNLEENVITEDGIGTLSDAPTEIWVGSTVTRPDGSVVTTTVSESEIVDDRLVNTSVIPFMRTIRVRFAADGMRQGTLVRGFIDGYEVTLNPDSGFSATDPDGRTRPQVNANGEVRGWFNIPEQRIPTGSRPFLLVDSENTSSAETNFTSQGILNTRQRTITTTRDIEVRTTPPPEPPPAPVPDEPPEATPRFVAGIGLVWVDPIAQSILVSPEGGAYISSLDLYFKKAPTATSAPEDRTSINAYIVEMENGLPTQNIVPLSKVTKAWQDVNANAEFPMLGKTTFTFKDPIYLEEGEEYAIVVHSNSRDYECWISTLGELDVFNGLPNGINPNDPDQNLTDAEIQALIDAMVNSNGQSTSGNGTVLPSSPSTGTGASNGLTGLGIAEQPYLGSLFKSQNSSTWTPYQQSTLTFSLKHYKFPTETSAEAYFVDDKYDVNGKPGVTTAEGLRKHVGGDTIRISEAIVNVGILSPAETSIQFSNRFFSGEPIGGLTLSAITNREKVSLGNEFVIDDENSVVVRAALQTQNSNLSPVIDRFQNRLIGYENLAVGEGEPDEGIFDLYDAGTYISPNVKLANSADDLKVILDSKNPSGSQVNVFFRTQESSRQYFEPKIDDGITIGSTELADRGLEGKVATLYGWTSESDGRLVLLRGGRRITADPDGQTTNMIITGIRDAIDDPNLGAVAPRVYFRSLSTFYDGLAASNPSTNPFSPNPYQQLDGTVVYQRKLLIDDEEEIIEDFDQIQTGAGSAPYVDCPQWSSGLLTAQVDLGKIVLHQEKLWRRVRITIVNPEPVEGGEDWIIISTISIGSAINLESSGGSWRPMKISQSPATSVDTRNQFAEYEYIPETRIESDFESFQIKVELKSGNRWSVPLFKNLRAIAAI